MRAHALAIALALTLSFGVAPRDQALSQSCASSVGPGIPPPVSVPSGISGFHAAWYGQSGYQSLCPGDRSTAVVAYYNSGSLGWVAGKMGEAAYLGTWGPSPGQDQATPFGGDGTNGSPNTGWPRYNRIATQPAPYVGPGQVAWFQFTIQAPTKPGFYKLYLRPLIEGATWMEDYGVFWQIVVLNPDGTLPPPPPPYPECSEWPAEMGLIFSKLPVKEGICLVRINEIPPDRKVFGGKLTDTCIRAGACLGGVGSYVWYIRAPNPTREAEIHVTHHEVCHSHQTLFWLRGTRLGTPQTEWPKTDEGLSFQEAWSQFKSQHPSDYVSWGDSGSFENFAEVCAAWYYPNFRVQKIVSFPPLLSFAQKWLPK